MEFVVMLILLVLVGAIILWPLLRREEPALAGSSPGPAPAPQDRQALTAIKELEFDYETGKIAEDDYRTLRARYEARAVAALTEQAPPAAPPDLDEALEAEIRAVRARRFCVSCGGGLPAGARFCPACGTPVAEVRR